MLHCHKVSVQPKALDLLIADFRCYGHMAECLPLHDIRNVNLDLWQLYACQRIPDRIAVVGICSGIDHDPFRAVKIGILDPVNDRALMI